MEAFVASAGVMDHNIKSVRLRATKADKKAVLTCRPAVDITLADLPYREAVRANAAMRNREAGIIIKRLSSKIKVKSNEPERDGPKESSWDRCI